MNESLDFKLIAEQNLVLSDLLDGVENGKRDDFYYNIGFGIQYRFGSKKSDNLNSVTNEN